MAKNQGNAKQHPEVELSLFENYSLFFHSGYYPKIIRDILKNVQKSTSVYMFKQYYMINYNENEAENEKQITQIQHKTT